MSQHYHTFFGSTALLTCLTLASVSVGAGWSPGFGPIKKRCVMFAHKYLYMHGNCEEKIYTLLPEE